MSSVFLFREQKIRYLCFHISLVSSSNPSQLLCGGWWSGGGLGVLQNGVFLRAEFLSKLTYIRELNLTSAFANMKRSVLYRHPARLGDCCALPIAGEASLAFQ